MVVLAGLYLLRPPGWAGAAAAAVGRLAGLEDEQARQGEEGAAAARLRALEVQVEQLRAEVAQGRAAAAAAEEELASARRDMRRLRADADRARAAARAAADAEEAERAAPPRPSRPRRASWSASATGPGRRPSGPSRRCAPGGRGARWRTHGSGCCSTPWWRPPRGCAVNSPWRRSTCAPRTSSAPPATDAASAPDAVHGRAPDDPARLADLLAMPQAHLIVDGYNVTKTGYGSLPLVEQRRRLVDALGPVAARTGAEVTVVFDGADVDGRAAQRLRGVRVLFSEPGTTADELVRRLVRAEPRGRPVVVVSSDKEVASGVRAAGARPVPATALLRLLARS